MTDPRWLTEARKYIGTKEIPGVKHEPLILQWWKAIKRGGIKTDEVPWCAAFVGAMLETVGVPSSRFESAKSYLEWGVRLQAAQVGCIVVFQREGGGHVAIVVGQDAKGRLMCLGGNQGNKVCVVPFERTRVLGYRWPPGEPMPALASLPIVSGGGASSVNEA